MSRGKARLRKFNVSIAENGNAVASINRSLKLQLSYAVLSVP
jgi:hypothetical protein